jgi:hypothetical protein
MKRDYTENESNPPNDLLKDIPQSQLAAVGAISFCYNYAENTINRMLMPCTGMAIEVYADVMSRINGIDGKIEIVKKGAKQRLRLPEEMLGFLGEILGNGHFKLLKKYRDAVIHARFINRETGIGELIESRGKHSEVLLTEQAIMGLYHRLNSIRIELSAMNLVLELYDSILALRDPDGPEKADLERDIEKFYGLAVRRRNMRLALPPLPDFPDADFMDRIPTDGEPITGVLEVTETPDGTPS